MGVLKVGEVEAGMMASEAMRRIQSKELKDVLSKGGL